MKFFLFLIGAVILIMGVLVAGEALLTPNDISPAFAPLPHAPYWRLAIGLAGIVVGGLLCRPDLTIGCQDLD